MPFSPKPSAPVSRISPETRLVNKTGQTSSKLLTPSKKRNNKQNKQHISYELLNHFNKNKYEAWRDRCLAEREQVGHGKSSQMHTLFRFWSLNLRKHFSRPMYKEFKKIAVEDAKSNETYGLQCLFRFYSYGLEKKFTPSIFDDFQLLVLDRYQKGDLYGLEKLVALLTYGADSFSEQPALHPVVRRLVSTEYPSLQHFAKSD